MYNMILNWNNLHRQQNHEQNHTIPTYSQCLQSSDGRSSNQHYHTNGTSSSSSNGTSTNTLEPCKHSMSSTKSDQSPTTKATTVTNWSIHGCSYWPDSLKWDLCNNHTTDDTNQHCWLTDLNRSIYQTHALRMSQMNNSYKIQYVSCILMIMILYWHKFIVEFFFGMKRR